MLILDEPVTSLDIKSQTKFYKVIENINEKRTTIIWSSHDLDALEKYAKTVICLHKCIHFHGHKYDFFSDDCALKSYTEFAMKAHNMHQHD